MDDCRPLSVVGGDEMFQGFKQFMLHGNVLDLAVAVVMGAAFGAVVTALVKDLITPLIAAIIGKPDFSAIEFTVNGSKFLIGDFINAVVSFLLIGAARRRDPREHARRPRGAAIALRSGKSLSRPPERGLAAMEPRGLWRRGSAQPNRDWGLARQ